MGISDDKRRLREFSRRISKADKYLDKENIEKYRQYILSPDEENEYFRLKSEKLRRQFDFVLNESRRSISEEFSFWSRMTKAFARNVRRIIPGWELY